MKPLRTGLAPAVTVAVFCWLCPRTALAFPEQFMGFLNALFHGMDFRKPATAGPRDWLWFFRALMVMSPWALTPGALFALRQHALLGRERLSRRMQHG